MNDTAALVLPTPPAAANEHPAIAAVTPESSARRRGCIRHRSA